MSDHDELAQRLRDHFRARVADLPTVPPPLSVPATARARRPTRRRLLVAAVALVLLLGGGILGWLVAGDGGDGRVVTVPSTSKPSLPSTTVPPTSATPTTAGSAGPYRPLVDVVGDLLDIPPAPGTVSSVAREQGEAGRYDEVRVRRDGEVLVVAVSDGFPDAPENLARFNGVLAPYDDAEVWLGADTPEVRAVHVVRGARVVYARSEHAGGAARPLEELRTLARHVLDAWVRPPSGPVEPSTPLDLSGDDRLRVDARLVREGGVWNLQWTPLVEPPPGTELWAVVVDGRLRGRTSARMGSTHGFPVGDRPEPPRVELWIAAQTFAGTTLATSPPLVVTA